MSWKVVIQLNLVRVVNKYRELDPIGSINIYKGIDIMILDWEIIPKNLSYNLI